MKKILILTLSLFISTQAFAGDQASYDVWVNQFKQKARAQGISDTTLNAAFNGSKFKPRVIELDRKQPESKMTFAQYKKRIVSDQRVKQGRHEFKKHRALLEEVGKAYGVQPQYIVALWGIETNFGSNTGGFDVIDALGTLAFEGRRAEFFGKELMNALKIIDNGHITAANMKGSWAGAMGQSQFMPSSFNAYAQDYDRDGKKDIWGTKADVFASAANYLSRSGWKGDERWGRLVSTRGTIPSAWNDRKNMKPLSVWRDRGVTLPNGAPLPHADIKGALVAPDGVNGPVYMAYGNYNVIMKWNRSTYFATSVGLLADAIAAGQSF